MSALKGRYKTLSGMFTGKFVSFYNTLLWDINTSRMYILSYMDEK